MGLTPCRIIHLLPQGTGASITLKAPFARLVNGPSGAAFALGMAVLSIPTLATAATTISVGDLALLVANRAGALVSVEITCDPAFGAGSNLQSLSVGLVQRAGNRVTQEFGGFFNIKINCDGTPQPFEILVPSSERIFRQGPAIVQSSAFICDPSFVQCESANATEEIELVRQ